jgi:hypothetical protein
MLTIHRFIAILFADEKNPIFELLVRIPVWNPPISAAQPNPG